MISLTRRAAAATIIASLLLCAIAASCRRQQSPPLAPSRSYPLGQSAPVGDLSLARSSAQLLAVHTDPATLSLVLTELTIPTPQSPACAVETGPTTFFERISDSAEAGTLFGNHVLLARPGRLDLFYHDLQSDGSGLTKWVHRSATDPDWWIDILPLSGLLLAALPEDTTSVRLVYQMQQTVYVSRSSAPENAQAFLQPFEAASRGQSVDGDPGGSFTVYDKLSKQLHLISDSPGGLSAQAIHAGGQVHFARLVDGRRVIVLYDRAKAALVVLEEQATPGQYSTSRVTPSEQTSMVYFGDRAGSRFYLFDEYNSAAPEERRYSLALLHALPDSHARPPGAAPTYAKVVLAAAPRPIRACQAVQAEQCLLVLCARDSLSLITVSLAGLPFGD